MERLKHIKEAIMACVEGEVMNLNQADTKELGEAIDMLKDLSEAVYYCTITEAMEQKEKDNTKHEVMYYPYPMYYPSGGGDGDGHRGYPMERYDPVRDMNGRMYYGGQGGSGSNSTSQGSSSNGSSSNSNGGMRSYYDMGMMSPSSNQMMRDKREGRSPMMRKSYMESKEMHHGKEAQLKELENYMHELTEDMTDMIKDSSPEEKQLLQKKIAALAEKVGKLNV